MKEKEIDILKNKSSLIISENIETQNKMRAAERKVKELEKARKFTYLQIKEDKKLFNKVAETKKWQERENIILMNKLELKETTIEDLQHQLSLHESNIKVIGRDGANIGWSLHIWQLLIEQIINGTPPSSVSKNIVSFTKMLCPKTIPINELPSVWTARKARTVITTIGETLAAYKLAEYEYYGQLHTDSTQRRQISRENILIRPRNNNGILLPPTLLTASIIAENSKSTTIANAIITAIREKSHLLTGWQSECKKMFPEYEHTIPNAAKISISKLHNGGVVTTDTCNAARKVARSLVNNIIEHEIQRRQEQRIIAPKEIEIFRQDCHNHLRNVWIGWINKFLSKYLANLLEDDLSVLNNNLRVSTCYEQLLISVDKCFSLTCNYHKGCGDEFDRWLEKYHPGVLMMPVIRALGSRQDLTVQGSVPLYWNRKYYAEFLSEALEANPDNILTSTIYHAIVCSEFIAITRLYAIIHLSICLPMRFLAGKSHEFENWSCRKMGKVVDLLEKKLIEISREPKKFLDYNFMIVNFFNEIKNEVEPLKEFLINTFEEKTRATIKKANNTAVNYNNSKVIPYRKVVDELFYPERIENQDTTNLVLKLAKEVAFVWLEELRDPKKATADYLSSIDGQFSWKNTNKEQQKKLLGTSATNDVAESPFATITENIQRFGRLTQGNAAVTAHAKINGDFDRKILGAESDGLFHQLPNEMRQSLISFAIKEVPKVRAAEREAIVKQQDYKQVKREAMIKNNLEKASKTYSQQLIFLEMYHSSACWKTVEEVNRIFRKIVSTTQKLEAIKDQIKMRVIGLGWKDLHHP